MARYGGGVHDQAGHAEQGADDASRATDRTAHTAHAASTAHTASTAHHHITLTERGPFLAPTCACGWYGPARRSRPLARYEAAAHLTAATDLA
jgi:hypothetical protein